MAISTQAKYLKIILLQIASPPSSGNWGMPNALLSRYLVSKKNFRFQSHFSNFFNQLQQQQQTGLLVWYAAAAARGFVHAKAS